MLVCILAREGKADDRGTANKPWKLGHRHSASRLGYVCVAQLGSILGTTILTTVREQKVFYRQLQKGKQRPSPSVQRFVRSAVTGHGLAWPTYLASSLSLFLPRASTQEQHSVAHNKQVKAHISRTRTTNPRLPQNSISFLFSFCQSSPSPGPNFRT